MHGTSFCHFVSVNSVVHRAPNNVFLSELSSLFVNIKYYFPTQVNPTKCWSASQLLISKTDVLSMELVQTRPDGIGPA